MADTLQEGLNQFRDVLYNANPDILSNFPGFSFNRDEFIFALSDKNTKLVSRSAKKYSIRVGKEDLIVMTDNGTSWDIVKYDGSTYTEGDTELIWIKKIVDSYIEMTYEYVNLDYKKTEYDALMSKINDEII